MTHTHKYKHRKRRHRRHKWVNAYTAATRNYHRTHSLAKSRKAARMQIFQNVRRLFGANGERMMV